MYESVSLDPNGDSPAQPRRRPGRPRLADQQREPDDNMSEAARRKLRIRQAQRSYRSRKEEALGSAKARVTQLEEALGSTLESFMTFHDFVAQKSQSDIPGDVWMQLGRTALDIATIVQRTGTENGSAKRDNVPHHQKVETDSRTTASSGLMNLGNDVAVAGSIGSGSEPGTVVRLVRTGKGRPARAALSPRAASFGQDNAPISQLVLEACLERAFELLHPLPGASQHCIPALTLPLQLERREELLARTIYKLNLPKSRPASDSHFDEPLAKLLPPMLRIVVGSNGPASPRMAPPQLQRLQFGRTRTTLRTQIVHLQGEWLEAEDVEEYLAERGIFIREGPFPSIPDLSTSPGNLAASHTSPNHGSETLAWMPANELTSNKASSQGDPGSDVVSVFEQYLGAGATHQDWVGKVGATQPSNSPRDMTVFGLRGENQHIPSGSWTFTPPGQFWQSFPDGLENLPDPGGELSTPDSSTSSIEITIDLDKLIEGLADRAICLGPSPGIRQDDVDEAIREAVVPI